MTEKELHKLKRSELLEIMVAQGREIERLRAELEQARQELDNRDILLSRCGSIAEASLRLNHIFEDAQKAAEQYVYNVRRMAAEKEKQNGKQ